MVSIICPSSRQAGDITLSRSLIIEAFRRQILRPVRLARSRTSPFHGGNTGSNPVRDAIQTQSLTAIPSLIAFPFSFANPDACPDQTRQEHAYKYLQRERGPPDGAWRIVGDDLADAQ